jgi:hypothetical protein
MSDVQTLLVLCGAALLILAIVFSSLQRTKRARVDYWLPDGTKLKRKAEKT